MGRANQPKIKQEKPNNVHVRCEPEFWKRVKIAAIRKGMSTQAFVGLALREYLKSEEA